MAYSSPSRSSTYVYKPRDGLNGSIRRSWLTADGPLYDCRNTNIKTVYDILKQSVESYPNNPYWGDRTLNKDGSAGDFTWTTYRDAFEICQNLKSGLANLGINPRDHVAVYGPNAPEWMAVDLAAQCFACCVVPLYDTLGPEAADYVLKNANCRTVFCTYQHLDGIMETSKTAEDLQFVVVFSLRPFEKTSENIQKYEATLNKYKGAGIPVYTFDDVLKKGAQNPTQDVAPNPEDNFTICYTSGTTGVPKGAVLQHHTLVSMSASVVHSSELQFQGGDVEISYLPLAHMFERLNQLLCLRYGVAVGFFRGDVKLLIEDIACLKPTIFAGVPRLWNRLYDKIMGQVEQSSAVKRFLFSQAFKNRLECVKQGIEHSKWDFAFKKVREVLGGRVRVITTGSAPVAGYILEFLRVVIGADVLEGYGQTECGAAATLTKRTDINPQDHVGYPISSIEVKLVSVPEMEYTVNDVEPDGTPVERGEICFRGNIFAGYWKMPEKTAEAIDSDGWLHSGDIGKWLPNGGLKIIDRKKNIFKLAQGEYVAPEKIENVYTRSKWIAQAFVYGDSFKPYLVCVIVPDEEQLQVYAQENHIPGKGMKEWCANDKIKQLCWDSMNQVAVDAKLHGFEKARAVHLHWDLFTPENGILTPTFKLKRNDAKKLFQQEIDAMYQQIESQPAQSKL